MDTTNNLCRICKNVKPVSEFARRNKVYKSCNICANKIKTAKPSTKHITEFGQYPLATHPTIDKLLRI